MQLISKLVDNLCSIQTLNVYLVGSPELCSLSQTWRWILNSFQHESVYTQVSHSTVVVPGLLYIAQSLVSTHGLLATSILIFDNPNWINYCTWEGSYIKLTDFLCFTSVSFKRPGSRATFRFYFKQGSWRKQKSCIHNYTWFYFLFYGSGL